MGNETSLNSSANNSVRLIKQKSNPRNKMDTIRVKLEKKNKDSSFHISECSHLSSEEKSNINNFPNSNTCNRNNGHNLNLIRNHSKNNIIGDFSINGNQISGNEAGKSSKSRKKITLKIENSKNKGPINSLMNSNSKNYIDISQHRVLENLNINKHCSLSPQDIRTDQLAQNLSHLKPQNNLNQSHINNNKGLLYIQKRKNNDCILKDNKLLNH